MKEYASLSGVTLTATPLDFVLGPGAGQEEPIWIALSNNQVVGNLTGTTVQILPDGKAPGFTVGYNSSDVFHLGDVSWVRVTGNNANVSLLIVAQLVQPAPLGPVSIEYVETSGGGGGGGNVTIVGPVDGSGNVLVDLATAVPAGANAIGSVSVSNFPATQPVSGSVAVSNFPATQPVSGTVTVVQPTGTNLHTVIDAGTASIGAIKPTQTVTITEDDSFAPTSIAAATAETVEVTGSTTLTSGQLVLFSLSTTTELVTAVSGAFIYVCIKGATSAKYYAVCSYGASVAGQFYVASAEKLNISVRNSLATGAVVMSGHWQAVT